MFALPVRDMTPPPTPTVCVVCGEPAYDPSDRDDAPWSSAASGDGIVCSAACAYRDAVDWHTGRGDTAGRIAAVRDAVEFGVDLPVLRVTYVHRGELFDSAAVLEGSVLGADGSDGIRFEDLEGESGYLAWSGIVDVLEVAE